MKDVLKKILNKKMIIRIALVILAVIGMGAALSLLLLFDMGADPFTVMNKAISKRTGLTFGTLELIVNSILFLFVLIFGRKYIGIGTIANMVLVGYSCDFFTYLISKINVSELKFDSFLHVVIFILALLFFLISAAIYMDTNLGVAPYDALGFVFGNSIQKIPGKFFKKIPFRLLRIVYDGTAVIIGLLFGAKIQLVTILMALLLGPSVDGVGKIGNLISKKINHKKGALKNEEC